MTAITTVILMGPAIIGTTAAILIGATLIGGATAFSARERRKSVAQQLKATQKEMPEVPDPGEAAAKAREALRKRRRYRTTYTSPLGIGGEAEIARKMLLGQ